MRIKKKLGLLMLLIALAAPISVKAELSEIVVDRPASSGQHVSGYTENDTGQIKNSLSTGIFTKRGYNVYLPKAATQASSNKRPAILLLHGAQRTGASLVERWREVADRNNVILIGPHANPGWNAGTDGQGFLTDVLKDAAKKYNIDTSRIYLFGHSMGGNMALIMAVTNQNQFAAIGVHAGDIPPEIYNIVEQPKRKTPLIIVNGTQDRGFPIQSVRRTAKVYADNGFDVELYIFNKHGHWYYDIAPAINDLVWDYFRNKSL